MQDLMNLGYLLFFMGGRAMFFIAGGLVCGIIAAIIASSKNRSAFGWFLLGCMFNIIAILFVGFMPALKQAPTNASTTVTYRPLPPKSQPKNSEFNKSLPEEFQNYGYLLEETGVAFDIENERLFLKNGDTHKIYQKSEIRDIQSNMHDLQQWSAGGNIMVRIADVEHPLWQIKFFDGNELARYMEIFSQFQEGVLKKPAPPVIPNAGQPGFCPHCGADCREYPNAVACYACHQYFNEAHQPLKQ